MPNFRYRALTQTGEIVHGRLSAPNATEVAARIEYLQLLPIETVEDRRAATTFVEFGLFGRPGRAEVTTFTRDLALLLKAGARLDDALELLAGDADVGRLRPVVAKLRAALLLSGELCRSGWRASVAVPTHVCGPDQGRRNFGNARPGVGTAGPGAIARRADASQVDRCDAVSDIRVNCGLLRGWALFFILFVLPQFSSVLQDFGNKSDSTLSFFFRISEFIRANTTALLLAGGCLIIVIWLILRRPSARGLRS